MPKHIPQTEQGVLRAYRVWDVPTRLFHWVNLLCVLGLTIVGLMMMYKKELGFEGLDAKIALKQLHAGVGLVFAANLLWRLVWTFFGNRYARWRAILPGGAGYPREVRAYIGSIRRSEPLHYAGHNPLGRLAVTTLFLLLVTMAVTGLVRAGTDVYMPPLGGFVQSYLAADGVSPVQLQPYDATGVDQQRMASLKEFKHPFGLVHVYTVYLLWALIVLHIAAVVVAEVREGDGLVSAMISGRKVLSGIAADVPPVQERER